MATRWSGEQLARLPAYLFFAIVGLTGIVFLVSCLTLEGGFHRAWEVLTCIRTPFGQASGLAVALSALGYLFVPTVIGIAVADAISRFTKRRLLTLAEAEAEIRRIAGQKKKPQV
jgi:hypothetical protein